MKWVMSEDTYNNYNKCVFKDVLKMKSDTNK